MKIAEVTATFPPYRGGVGNVAYHNARLLAERGHQVTVITQPSPPEAELAEERFGVRRLTPLLRLGNAPWLKGLISSLKEFDLIHLHYPFIFGAEMSLWAAKRHNIPLLLTYHNRLIEKSGAKRLLFPLYNLLMEGRVVRLANARIAVSKDHFDALFEKVSCVEVPNGVDTRLFSPHDSLMARHSLGLPPHAPLVLFVGGLDAAHRFKNVPGLLRALSYFPQYHLAVVGRGELVPALRDLARHLNLMERIHFDDNCPTKRLPLYYSAADVTVLPSNRTESFGIVLAESMACGTPVIATNLPGVRDVVRHGKTGFIVPVNDDATLAAAIQWMISHRQERQEMGQQGRIHAARQYDWEVVGDKLELACRQAINGTHKAAALHAKVTMRK